MGATALGSEAPAGQALSVKRAVCSVHCVRLQRGGCADRMGATALGDEAPGGQARGVECGVCSVCALAKGH